MKRHRFKIFVVCIILLGTSELAFAQCDQTLNPGANLASAISSAAAGTTICLNSGDYGIQTIDNIQKASTVTVRSTTGVGAVLAVRISRLQNVTFSSLTLGVGVSWINDNNQTPRSLNLSFLNMTHTAAFHARTEGVTSARNWVFDGGTMHDVAQSTFEGRFQVCCGGSNVGITIKNYTFSNTTACGGPLTPTTKSDGIQFSASGVTIGPGNTFRDIRQCGGGAHVDAIQVLGGSSNITITGNYFTIGTIYIGIYDGGSNITVTHNVFDTPADVLQNLQLNLTSSSFQHNTFIDTLAAVGAKAVNPPVTGFTWKDNLHQNSRIIDSGDQPGCQLSCVYDFNMFSSVEQSRGTNVIIGLATFVEGINPSTWAGHRLTLSSLGHQSASDGNDMGIVSNLSVPAAPSNLRVAELWWTRPMALRYRGRSLPPQPWGVHGAGSPPHT